MAAPPPAPLAPLCAALISRARTEATQIMATAETDAQRTLAEARAEAAAVLSHARSQGESEAAAMLETEAARARQVARGLVLAAQRAVYDELRDRADSAVRVLLDDPRSRAGLAAALRRRLGDHATVRDQPDGGLFAQTDDGRSIDASIRALVDGALDGKDLEQLWGDS